MALSTNTRTQSMGIVNMAFIRAITDASAAAATTFDFGFKPRKVVIHNLTDRISHEWFEGMSDNTALKTVAVGTRTLEAAEGPTMGTEAAGTANSVTFPAAIMLASKTFAIEAVG